MSDAASWRCPVCGERVEGEAVVDASFIERVNAHCDTHVRNEGVTAEGRNPGERVRSAWLRTVEARMKRVAQAACLLRGKAEAAGYRINPEPPLRDVEEENERLHAFLVGPAPEWEQANATLKHQARDLEAQLQEANGLLERRSNDADNMLRLYEKAEAQLQEAKAVNERLREALTRISRAHAPAEHLQAVAVTALFPDPAGGESE